jgi:hypothetical protein
MTTRSPSPLVFNATSASIGFAGVIRPVPTEVCIRRIPTRRTELVIRASTASQRFRFRARFQPSHRPEDRLIGAATHKNSSTSHFTASLLSPESGHCPISERSLFSPFKLQRYSVLRCILDSPLSPPQSHTFLRRVIKYLHICITSREPYPFLHSDISVQK